MAVAGTPSLADFHSHSQQHHLTGNFLQASLRSATSLQQVREIHLHLSSTRLIHTTPSLADHLLQKYVKYEALAEASHLHRHLPHKWDVISWTCMISAFARKGDLSQCFYLFHLMHLQGAPRPNNVTLISILTACTSLPEIESLYSIASESGLVSDSAVGSALVTMFGRHGALQLAEEAFQRIIHRNAISWTAVITANAKIGDFLAALKHFQRMQLDGIRPDCITFITLVNACSTFGSLSSARTLQGVISESGVEVDLMLGNALVHMFGECESVSEADLAFDSMPVRDDVAWNSLIGAYVRNGRGADAMTIFRLMLLDGFSPTKVTYLEILNAPVSAADAHFLHLQIESSGYHSDVVVATGLVNLYGKSGRLDSAFQVFEAVPDRDVVLWTTLIAAYAQGGHTKTTLILFRRMQLEGVLPNGYTFVAALESCTSPESLPDGKLIHSCAREGGSSVTRQTVVGNAVLNMYSKCGSLRDASEVFHRMERRDVVSWNSMLAALAQHDKFPAALTLYREMNLGGFRPDGVTFVTVLDVCTRYPAHSEARLVHSCISESGYHTDTAVGAALVNVYGKLGDFSTAVGALERIHRRDIFSWSAIISAYAQRGRSGESVEYLRRMELDGVEGNEITYVNVLSTCSHAGMVEECCRCFGGLEVDHGLRATPAHFGCVIDTLSRAGHLYEAAAMIKRMPLQDRVAWMTLLGGCRLNGDDDRGNEVAQRLISSNPDNASAYVALTNMLNLKQQLTTN